MEKAQAQSSEAFVEGAITAPGAQPAVYIPPQITKSQESYIAKRQ